MKDWDYAELVKDAKNHGGPEEYIESIKENAFEEGRESRNKEVLGVFIGGAGAASAIAFLWSKWKNRKERRRREREEAQKAEKELVQMLTEADEEKPDTTE